MKKIVITLAVIMAIFTANYTLAERIYALDQKNSVIIKNGSSLLVYTLEVYENGQTNLTTDNFNSIDVGALQMSGVPSEAWPLFATNNQMLFSAQTFVLEKENTKLQNELKIKDVEIKLSKAINDGVSLWAITSSVALIVLGAIFLIYYVNASTKLRKLRGNLQH